jgi:hypothetical protein
VELSASVNAPKAVFSSPVLFVRSAFEPAAVFSKPVLFAPRALNPNALLKSPLASGSAPVPNMVFCVGPAITVPVPSSEAAKNAAAMGTHKNHFINLSSVNLIKHPSLPVLLPTSAATPIAVFLMPVLLLKTAKAPVAVFLIPTDGFRSPSVGAGAPG